MDSVVAFPWNGWSPCSGFRSMTSVTHPIDAQRLALILNDLRLPAIKLNWPDIAQRADKEGWRAARFLAALAEHEIAERDRRRIERHLGEARLPPGKTLDSFAFDAVPALPLMPKHKPPLHVESYA